MPVTSVPAKTAAKNKLAGGSNKATPGRLQKASKPSWPLWMRRLGGHNQQVGLEG